MEFTADADIAAEVDGRSEGGELLANGNDPHNVAILDEPLGGDNDDDNEGFTDERDGSETIVGRREEGGERG